VAPEVSVAPEIIILMTATTGALMVLVLFVVMRQRRQPQTVVGVSHISQPLVPLGTQGEVRRPLGPTGTIFAAGEEWTARSDRGPLERGTAVRVTGNDGMVLMVEPMTAIPESTEGTA
jgi:membrane-bound ClpP family serine protease